MAVTTSTAANPLITTIVTDTDSDITVETAASAAQNLYFVEIANTNTVAVYTKLIAAASGSNNSTQHYIQLYCPANTTCYFYVPASVAIAFKSININLILTPSLVIRLTLSTLNLSS